MNFGDNNKLMVILLPGDGDDVAFLKF